MNELLLAVFLLTQVGDFVTTKIAIQRGAVETFALAEAAMEQLGWFGLFLVKAWASGLMIWTYFSGLTGDVFPVLCGLLIVFYGVVLFNNIKVIRKLST